MSSSLTLFECLYFLIYFCFSFLSTMSLKKVFSMVCSTKIIGSKTKASQMSSVSKWFLNFLKTSLAHTTYCKNAAPPPLASHSLQQSRITNGFCTAKSQGEIIPGEYLLPDLMQAPAALHFISLDMWQARKEQPQGLLTLFAMASMIYALLCWVRKSGTSN